MQCVLKKFIQVEDKSRRRWTETEVMSLKNREKFKQRLTDSSGTVPFLERPFSMKTEVHMKWTENQFKSLSICTDEAIREVEQRAYKAICKTLQRLFGYTIWKTSDWLSVLDWSPDRSFIEAVWDRPSRSLENYYWRLAQRVRLKVVKPNDFQACCNITKFTVFLFVCFSKSTPVSKNCGERLKTFPQSFR